MRNTIGWSLLCAILLGLIGCGGSGTGGGTPAGSDDTVLATASVSGTVNAVVGSGSHAVALTFNTSDGKSATDLAIDLSALPTGWSAAAGSFSCATISTGNGCLLNLTYAPPADAQGTLTLKYSFTNNAGTAEQGSVQIAYAATAHDNVVATPSPSGQISTEVGASQAVTVTFTTDDGNVATHLALSTALSSLPSGWTSQSGTFTCSSVSTGNTCKLPLTYAPAGAGGGTLTLNYGYTDNAGTAQTGSVAIPYVATTNDNAVVTVSPGGTLQVVANATQTVTVTFTTDDGNVATALAVSGTALSTLPSGWSTTSGTFSCAGFSTGSACQLNLTFAPTGASGGTLNLGYTYLDNAGIAKSGTVSIVYESTVLHAYVADEQLGILMCSIGASGALSGCAVTGSGYNSPLSIVFYGNYAYVGDEGNTRVDVCPVNSDGTLGTCLSAYSIQPSGNLAVNGPYLYIPWGDPSTSVNGPTACAIGSNGSLSNCTETGADASETSGAAFFGQYVFISTYGQHGDGLLLCTDGTGGSITGCNGVYAPQAFSTTIYQGSLYMTSNPGVTICALASDATLSNCTTSTAVSYGDSNWETDLLGGFAASEGHAYVTYEADDMSTGSQQTGVAVCTINTDGSLSACADSGSSFGFPTGITIN